MRPLPTLQLPIFTPQLRSSLTALLGRSEPKAEVLEARMEVIRELMLNELGDYAERKFPSVTRRVRYAPDIQGLWYARSDVMAILATTYGETIAREKVAEISGRFNGLMPKSLTKKFSFKPR